MIMGTLYYAIGKNKREAYELGKSNFDFLATPGGFKSCEHLTDALRPHFQGSHYDNEAVIEGVVQRVARDLWGIDCEFEVVSEHAYASAYEGIFITGSMFPAHNCVGDLLSTCLSD